MHTFSNKEVNKVLQWWLTEYGYEIKDTNDGILMIDLQQTGEDKIVTEEYVIKYFIEQIDGKLHHLEFDLGKDRIEAQSFKKDLEILKHYSTLK